MSIGAYPGETDIQRGKRRIVVGYFFFGALTRLVASRSSSATVCPGWLWSTLGRADQCLALGVLRLKPHWFVGIVNAALFFILVEVLAATVILGGLVPSEM